MDFKVFFRWSIVFCVLSIASTVAQAEDSRRNVLFIISDDLNTSLGCYGHPQVRSPNIDRLAARGVRFENAYCQFPLCGPSRNSMLTGLYPNSSGILANGQIFRQTIPRHHSLSQALRLNGYFAARIGKLYHYNVPKSVGTNGHDDPGSWELELNPAGCDRLLEEGDIFSLSPGNFGGTLSWYASPRKAELHTDGMLAADARWVLERCARDTSRPFFVALGFYRPHTPYVAPKVYFDDYAIEQMPVVSNVDEDRLDIPKLALASAKREQDRMSDPLRREAVQAYFASITFMDAQVGKVLDALDELGLADSTTVVFTSDHGYHLGEHGLWQKMSLFEQSAQVPLIIAAPGLAAKGSVVQSPVGLIDIYPTITELCGVDSAVKVQGQSLVPMLRDPAVTGRGWTLSQVTRGRRDGDNVFGYSIRTARFRLTRWGKDGADGLELYDHEVDPQELTNLAEHPDQSDRVMELSSLLDKAVAGTFPEDGKMPAMQVQNWAPNLTDP